MDYSDTKKRILAAQALLMEPSSSFGKFHAVKQLLSGAHPHLDAALKRAELDLRPIEQILGKDFFGFAAENLPENTEEQKKRKKYVLLFWKAWNSLRSEVARVQEEMQKADQTADEVVKTSHWARIYNFAKGPFGIATILAVGLVSASAYTSVAITIYNKNCGTMMPSVNLPIPVPGISFPKDPIPAGSSAQASLPGLSFTIDATQKGTLSAKVLTYSMNFQLGDVSEVTLDGVSLLGKVTNVNLGEKKSHDLVFTCK
jgi:hypothetical protein